MKATICQDRLWSNIRTLIRKRAFVSQLHVRGLHVEGVGTVFCTQIFYGFQRQRMLQGLPRQTQDSDENGLESLYVWGRLFRCKGVVASASTPSQVCNAKQNSTHFPHQSTRYCQDKLRTREVYSSFCCNITMYDVKTGRLLLRRRRQPAAPDAHIHREGFCADTHAEWCDWEYDHVRR